MNFPRRVTLELTDRCNLRCSFCPRRHFNAPQGAMNPDLFKRIVDECTHHLPVTLVPFFRGEPLLHPEMISLLRHAREQGLGPIQLTTNATLLDPDTAAELIAMPLDFLNISLDTRDPALYEASRRGANFQQVNANVLRLLELRQEARSALPVIQVSSVDTDAYRPHKQEFIDFWRCRVERVRIYVEHSRDGSFGSIARAPHSDRRLPCRKPFTDLVVYWDGTVALCNHDWQRSDSLGDARTSTLAQIWQGPAYEQIRHEHESGVITPDTVCAHCDHWMMFYMEMLGELYEDDPHCQTTDR